MHAPEVGEPGGVEPLPPFRRRPERLGRAADIVLKQPGFSQRALDLNVFVPVKTRLAEAADQEGSRFGPHSTLEGPNGLSVKISR